MTTTIGGSYPAVNSDSDATINGLTVGKGAGTSGCTVFGNGATTAYTNSTAIGYQTLASGGGGNETAVGYRALYTAGSSSGLNTAIGASALYLNSSGINNFAGGYQALYSNTTASNNTAVGYQAGYTNATGSGNTFIGNVAGYTSTGNNNTLIGFYTGYSLTTGSGNTFIGNYAGYGSGYYVTTGSKNTIIGGYSGNQGGLDIRTASNYVVLSDGDGNIRQVIDNNGSVLFGKTSTGITTNGYVINAAGDISQVFGAGNYSVINSQTGASTWVSLRNANSEKGSIVINSGSVSYNTTSDYRLKENVTPITNALTKISLLKPVNYTWKDSGEPANGFIAHELQEIAPDCVTGEKDAVDNEGNPKYQAIDTSFLMATLVSAIQELKAEFDAYKATHP